MAKRSGNNEDFSFQEKKRSKIGQAKITRAPADNAPAVLLGLDAQNRIVKATPEFAVGDIITMTNSPNSIILEVIGNTPSITVTRSGVGFTVSHAALSFGSDITMDSATGGIEAASISAATSDLDTIGGTELSVAPNDVPLTYTSPSLVLGVGGTAYLFVVRTPSLVTTSASMGSLSLDLNTATVSQLTDISTAVTLDAAHGRITTQAADAIAGASNSFTVNNSAVGASSTILASITSYTGGGEPILYTRRLAGPGYGGFTVHVRNIHASDALDAALEIGFVVVQQAGSLDVNAP